MKSTMISRMLIVIVALLGFICQAALAPRASAQEWGDWRVIITPAPVTLEGGSSQTFWAEVQKWDNDSILNPNWRWIPQGDVCIKWSTLHGSLTKTKTITSRGIGDLERDQYPVGSSPNSYTAPTSGTIDTVTAKALRGRFLEPCDDSFGVVAEATATIELHYNTAVSVAPATAPYVYGSTTSLSATLTKTSGGSSELSGKTIDFMLDGTNVGSAVTDSSGVATLNDVLLAGIDVGIHDGYIGASFAGDRFYYASSGAGTLKIEPPPVKEVTSEASGAYGVGSFFEIQVVFTDPVVVNTTGGTPTLILETGATDREARYTKGSGGNALVFFYQVQPGDNSADLDYVSTSALQLNGGTIKRGYGSSEIVLTLPPPGDVDWPVGRSLAVNKDIVIDTRPPEVTITRVTGSDGIVDDSPPFEVVTNIPITITWSADEDGSYLVGIGSGTSCTGGYQGENLRGTYYKGTTVVSTINPVQPFNEGDNNVQVCVTDSLVNTGAAGASVLGDTRPPVAHPRITEGMAGLDGWYRSDVSVAWDWWGADIDSDSCTRTSVSSGEGSDILLSATCKDLAGNQGTGSYAVKVDTTAPATTLASTPASTTASTSATFAFQGDDQDMGGGASGVTGFECALGSAGVSPTFATCSSPKEYSGLTSGDYVFYVRALDAAGNYDASPATYSWTVLSQSSQNITFGPLASKTYGDAPFEVSATATSGLAVSFAATGNCTVSGNTVTITGAGSCTVTATQSGNESYLPAMPVARTFDIAKSTAAVVLSSLAQTYDGSPKPADATTTPAGLTASFTYDGSTTPPTNAGSYTVVATVIDPNYSGSASGILEIAKATPVIAWSNPAAIAYGTALSATQLNATAGLNGSAVLGSFAYDPASGTVLSPGSHQALAATFAPTDSSNYNGTSATVYITVDKAVPVISWSTPADITYGTALSGTQLNATADVAGSFVYSPAAGVKLDAGRNQTLHVVFTPADTTNYDTTGKDVTINVSKASQTISFAPLADRTYGDADFKLSATAGSGLAVGFSVGAADNCTLVGTDTVHITGAGSCTVAASQPGDSNYEAAADVQQTFTISKGSATLTLGNLSQTYDGSAKAATVTTSPGGVSVVRISYSQGGSPVAAPTNAGSYDVVASLDNPNYQAINATGTLVIAKASQTITFATLTNKTYGDAPFTVGATGGGSGNSVTFTASPSTVCTSTGTSGATITLVGNGDCTVTASQVGNANYDAAANVQQKFSVGKRTLTVAAEDKSVQFSDPLPTLTTKYSGFASGEGTANLTAAPTCSVQGSGWSPGANGIVQSPAGDYAIKCSGGLAANYSFSYADGKLTVSKENVAARYAGDSFVLTPSSSATSAQVNLAARLTQEVDSYPGDLTKAKVRFELYKSGNLGTNPDQTVGNVSVDASGKAQSTATVAVDDAWTILVKVEQANGYWTTSTIGTSILTVAQPQPGKRVFGSGSIPYTEAADGQADFGFTVIYQTKGDPRGHSVFLFQDKADGFDYFVKSTSWQGGGMTFNADPAKAMFSGKCVVQRIDHATGAVVASFGNYSFTVNLFDGNQKVPAQPDTYAIAVLDASNKVWRQVGAAASPLAVATGSQVTVQSK